MSTHEENDALFTEAVRQLRQVEGVWQQQLELALTHPVQLDVNYDSLGGRFELVQPFIHQALSGTLGALSHLAWDAARGETLRAAVSRVVVTAGSATDACKVTIADGVLTAIVPLAANGEDPTAAINAAIRQSIDDIGAPRGDLYSRVPPLIVRLEAAMRDTGLWPGDKPEGHIEVRGAFGSENMSFAQWLAWVLIPRLQEIVRERGEFPSESNLAAYAVRELDGFAGLDAVHDVLYAIDEVTRTSAAS